MLQLMVVEFRNELSKWEMSGAEENALGMRWMMVSTKLNGYLHNARTNIYHYSIWCDKFNTLLKRTRPFRRERAARARVCVVYCTCNANTASMLLWHRFFRFRQSFKWISTSTTYLYVHSDIHPQTNTNRKYIYSSTFVVVGAFNKLFAAKWNETKRNQQNRKSWAHIIIYKWWTDKDK